MAKVDCSALVASPLAGILGGGTGMYVEIREARDTFWTECSGSGPSGVCIETARPLKQGMVNVGEPVQVASRLGACRYLFSPVAVGVDWDYVLENVVNQNKGSSDYVKAAT